MLDTKKMRACSYLLPDPGGEVVRECLYEVERLTAEVHRLSMLLQDLGPQLAKHERNPYKQDELPHHGFTVSGKIGMP
jgi:hypothetical protein